MVIYTNVAYSWFSNISNKFTKIGSKKTPMIKKKKRINVTFEKGFHAGTLGQFNSRLAGVGGQRRVCTMV